MNTELNKISPKMINLKLNIIEHFIKIGSCKCFINNSMSIPFLSKIQEEQVSVKTENVCTCYRLSALECLLMNIVTNTLIQKNKQT